MTMKLESLASELLFDVFDYMSIGQILRSFQSLNSRFNQLIFAYLRTTCHLDLRFMSLNDSNIFFQSQLSRIVNQIISMTVSNGDETPLQIEFFRCDDFRFRQFRNLQSLSLYHIHSLNIMMEIALECDYLPHLIHINLIDCCFSSNNNLNYSLINKIWNMPKLIHCNISTRSYEKHQSIWPSVISTSLKYVSIQNLAYNTCSLPNLFQCTPHLRCLYIYSNFEGEYTAMPLLPLLVKFEFNDKCSLNYLVSIRPDELEILLQKMPNLCHLSIESLSMFMDGYQWENVITNYLPKLKIFRCRMRTYFNNLHDIEERVDNLICSFQSHFWLENHQWYIRCHWKSENKGEDYILYYTLPYTLTHSMAKTDYFWSISTCPRENDYWPSDSVHKLLDHFGSLVKFNSFMEVSSLQELNTSRTTSPQRSITCCERISKIFRLNSNETQSIPLSVVKNYLMETLLTRSLDSTRLIPRYISIRELSVQLPFDKHVGDFIPKLDQLISLNVTLSTDYTNQSHLQILLNQAPNLYSLSVVCSTTATSKVFLTDIRNASIRKLGLPAAAALLQQGIFYNIKQCVQLSRSPLGKQCEILSIGVQNKECVVYLINEMINLRLLTVRSYDNYITSLSSRGKCYGLITWLKFSLPSTIKIAKYDCCENHIQLWIR